MESSVTGKYDNTENVADINKQEAYSQNTMDYSEDKFAGVSETPSDSFQVADDPYNVQHDPTVYNPAESVQHISYQQQDQNLGNVTSYYSNQETPLQDPYIPEQPQLQDSSTVHTSNGINEEQIVANIETQNSEDNLIENTTVGENNVNLTEPAVINIDLPDPLVQTAEEEEGSAKTEHDDIQTQQYPDETTNSNELTTSNDNTIVETTKTEENEEIILQESSENDEVIKEETLSTEVTQNSVVETVDIAPIQEAVLEPVEGTTSTESVETTEQLQTDQQLNEVQDEYVYVEGPTTVDVTSSQESTCTEQPETQSESLVEEPEEKKPKQRKTRKPIHDLPMHLIGHDISKPVESVPNGRALPKPRLGVKLPYRNLTSQIVTKAELEEEIIERSRAKELATGKFENKFARSLTQRLANRIAPEKVRKSKKPKETDETASKSIEIEETVVVPIITEKQTPHGSSTSSASVDESKIENDDDLLAILEGEGEEIPVMQKEMQDIQVDDSNLKLLEREIALQQLLDLPHQEPKERIVKSRFPKTISPIKSEVQQSKSKPEKSSNSFHLKESSHKPTTPKSELSSPKKTPSINADVASPVRKPVEVEPQVKVNMVLKTYSRKRKPSDLPEFEMPSPKRSAFEDPDANDIYDKGDPLALPTDVYITKSSRVIKKKVIWDPDDEQSPRGSKTSKVVESNKLPSSKVVKPIANVEKSEKLEIRKSGGTPVEKPKPELKSAEKDASEKQKKVVKNKSPKSKRGLSSEVDRLLMDEGAIKMLYELKANEEDSPTKKKKNVYSVEKAEKEILKKASLLKNDLVQNTSNESPKSLRKKEGPVLVPTQSKQPPPILERKMSKDSARSSVHTPPRSPTFFSSQASMLIRRRSSSSISSDDNMDGTEESSKVAKQVKKGDASRVKKQKKNATNEKNSSENNETKTNEKIVKELTMKPMKGAQYKSFTMKKFGKHVSIDLKYIDNICYFTIQVLEELTTALKRIEKDKDCNVVSITSQTKAFCLGLDYNSLVSDDKTERIDKATDLAENIREFLLCLLSFPKILVAGIEGECIGLGVTMLSLFDMVIASDAATFSTPYASLGCLGEATFLLTYPVLSNSGLAADLLYANQTLKADEALRHGLISKLCWPEKYKDTLSNFLTAVDKGSRQSLETTKRQLRANLQDQIEAAINDEMDILIQHWTSPECQENFSKIVK